MSLPELAASPRTDIIEGKTFSPYTLESIGMFQSHLEQKHLARVAIACTDLDDETGQKLMDSAQNFVVNGNLAYGTKAFNTQAIAVENLPFLLYIGLKDGDKKMTPTIAGKLINDENRAKVQRACLETGLGWVLPKNEQGEAPKEQPLPPQ